MQDVLAYLKEHEAQHVEELFALVRYPSVSADPEHKGDMLACAEHIRAWLEKTGFAAKILPTPGPPAVYAEWLGAPGAPTVLSYGHYDVQPADPLELWDSPPFEPEVRDGKVFARGACDDKGQFMTHLLAAAAHLAAHGRLPVNLKVILEGEEEIGSPHTPALFQEQKELLAADVAVVSDTSQLAPGEPSICYGLRGLVYFQLDMTGPDHDLHSGEYGGTVANPAHVLAGIIARLIDDSGRITVPGFYDAVRAMEPWEKELMRGLGVSDETARKWTGAPALFGEAGFSALERTWFRPSLDCNGMVSGYTGIGAKTVLPAKASAKISMRLVPDQNPEAIARAFTEYVQSLAPATVELKVECLSAAPPVLMAADGPWMSAARRVLAEEFGKDPVLTRMGGSIPIVTDIGSTLGLDVLMLGWGLPDDRAHSPNEKFDLSQFHAGTRAMARLYAQLAQGAA